MISLFVIAWFSNYPVLAGLFDLESCSEQYRFWKVRSIVYELMFLTLTVSLFIKGAHLEKVIACFISILIASSIVDKLFDLHSYMYSDLILIVLSLIVSFIVWKKFRKK